MSDLTPVGIRLVAENQTDFTAAVNGITQSVQNLTKVLMEAQSAATPMLSGLTGVQAGMNQAQSSTEGANSALSSLSSGGMAMAVTAGNLLSSALESVIGYIDQAVQKFENLVSQAIQTAGRFEEMTQVTQLVGQAQGYTADQVQQFIDAVRGAGIEAGDATDILTRFAQNNIQMADALKLVKVAQDAAVVSNSNSSDTAERLMWGIVSLNTVILRTAGLTVDATQAYEAYAKANNLTASALTENQKQQAMLNAVVEAGAKIQGAYAVAMQDPYKLQGSMVRITDDLLQVIGKPFLDAWMNVLVIQEDVTKAFTAAIDVGGKLAPLFQTIGAAAEVVTGYIKDFVISLVSAKDASGNLVAGSGPLIDWIANTATAMADAADKALNWGVNIVVQFADGLIEGADTVLTSAMDYIGQILSYFLAPGSPPKVAPELDTWGIKAMDTYLQGFSDADFSALTAIENPLKTALTQIMGQAAGGEAFSNLMPDISKMISSGTVDTSLLSKISGMTGVYGGEITKLITEEIALAKATNAVTAAQKDLTDAQQAASDANDKVNSLMAEYNAMVTSGASTADLKAKRDEVEAAEKAAIAANKDVTAKEKAVKAAQAAAQPIADQVKLQQQLVAEIERLGQAQQAAANAGGAGGKGGSGAAAAAAAGAAAASSTAKTVDAAFEAMKTNISNKLQELAKPFVDLYNNKIAPIINQLSLKWQWFSGIVSEFYNKYIKPVVDQIVKLIPPDLVKNIGWVVGAFVALAVPIGIIVGLGALLVGILNGWVGIIILVVGSLALLKSAWDNNWGGIRTTLTAFWTNTLLPAFTAIREWLAVNIPIAIQAVSKFWNTTLLPALQNVWKFIQTSIIPIFIEIGKWLSVNIPVAIQAVSKFWTTILLPALQAIWKFITTTLVPIFLEIVKWLSINIPIAIQAVAKFWNTTLLPALQAIWKFISTTLVPIFVEIWNWLSVNIPAAIKTVSDFWNKSLLPALTAIWDYISKYVLPLFQLMANFLSGVFTLAINGVKLALELLHPYFALVGGAISALHKIGIAITQYTISVIIVTFENLWKVFKTIHDFVTNMLTHAFETLLAVFALVSTSFQKGWKIVDDFVQKLNDLHVKIQQGLAPVIQWFTDNVIHPLTAAWDAVSTAISKIIGFIGGLGSALSGIQLPSWLKPGSPTPFENGLVGIAGALDDIANSQLPKLQSGFGVITQMGDLIQTTLVPAFSELGSWLTDKLPNAIKIITSALTDVFSVALHETEDFLETKVFPIFQAIGDFIKNIFTTEITGLTDTWKLMQAAAKLIVNLFRENLLPVITSVSNYIRDVFLGQLKKVWQEFTDVYALIRDSVITILNGLLTLWSTQIQPFLKDFWQGISDLIDIFTGLWNKINNDIAPRLNSLISDVLKPLERAFGGIESAVGSIIGRIGDFISMLANMHLPTWLQPGSPTPFEIGLRGISDAINEVASYRLPHLQASLDVDYKANAMPALSAADAKYAQLRLQMAALAPTYNQQQTTYTLGGVYTSQSPQVVVQSFQMLRVLTQ